MPAGVIIASFTLLSLEATAGPIAYAKDFAVIGRGNVFRLSAPQPEQKREVVQPELPQVSLQGLTTLLNSRQALLKIQSKSKPVAIGVYCVLNEGQARDGIGVRRIDMASGTVWLTNQGTEQVMTVK